MASGMAKNGLHERRVDREGAGPVRGRVGADRRRRRCSRGRADRRSRRRRSARWPAARRRRSGRRAPLARTPTAWAGRRWQPPGPAGRGRSAPPCGQDRCEGGHRPGIAERAGARTCRRTLVISHSATPRPRKTRTRGCTSEPVNPDVGRGVASRRAGHQGQHQPRADDETGAAAMRRVRAAAPAARTVAAERAHADRPRRSPSMPVGPDEQHQDQDAEGDRRRATRRDAGDRRGSRPRRAGARRAPRRGCCRSRRARRR